jgi:gamma-glutamyltranspeptidase/glutathione hydrolase
VLSSLGGGGFLMASPVGLKSKTPILYDFFTQTPKQKNHNRILDFHPIIADFGEATQEFHIGLASVATPGMVKGIFKVHRDLCSMPMKRIIEPALATARKGFTVNRLQAYLFQVVGPIYMNSIDSRSIFSSHENPEVIMGEGEIMTNPEFANTLEFLAKDGEDFFYRGEFASAVADICSEGGGFLNRDDFESYRVRKRLPLVIDYRDARLFTNPVPSTGGILIAFALDLLKSVKLDKLEFGSLDYMKTLISVMDLTNQARVESGLSLGDGGNVAAETLLNPKFLSVYKKNIMGRSRSHRGTTHISIIDSDCNAASLTMSNGEGAGIIVPGTGVMLNNMLGEEDINPNGFHHWQQDTRLCSMMSPSLLKESNGSLTALGSGGSNRIRTAILQVLVNLLDFSMSVEKAVEAPRLHYEDDFLNLENGFPSINVAGLSTQYFDKKVWDDRNLFFGGVHVARYDFECHVFKGSGDPRRGGASKIV